LVFASPQPKPINDAQRDAIMRAVRAGMHSFRELKNARAKEKALREYPSTDEDLTKLQEWNDWNRKVADQKVYMEYHFNYAIELAREHYGICWPQCDSEAVKNGRPGREPTPTIIRHWAFPPSCCSPRRLAPIRGA
jgi:hypothetical protein